MRDRISFRNVEASQSATFQAMPHCNFSRDGRKITMHSHRLPLLAAFLVCSLCSLCGCQLAQRKAANAPQTESATSAKKSFDAATRNNALALLNDLLNDEKNVSKILIIKRDSEELKRLIKDISAAAGNGAKLLKSFAQKNPNIQLAATDLPPGEAATRKAISKTKEQELLHTKDVEFEFQLLLTQSEAMNYGAHLAQVAAENEPQPQRARALSTLSTKLKMLHDQVLTMLRKKH